MTDRNCTICGATATHVARSSDGLEWFECSSPGHGPDENTHWLECSDPEHGFEEDVHRIALTPIAEWLREHGLPDD